MKRLLFLMTSIVISATAEVRTQIHMGTLIQVNVDDIHASDSVFEIFKEADQILSSYKSDSEISRLNRGEITRVSPLTYELIERSVEMNRLTKERFDITIGSLTQGAYRFGEDERVPNQKTINKALRMVGGKRITMHDGNIYLQKGTKLDLGGIGKGYTVDRSLKRLGEMKISRAVVAASGDIACLGECSIGIQDPFDSNKIIGILESKLPRLAVSTSGNYERYIRDKRHNHLIDPKSGHSEQHYASVTLFDTDDNTRLDALATAITLMDEAEAFNLLDRLGIGYVIIRNDGKQFKYLPFDGITMVNKAN